MKSNLYGERALLCAIIESAAEDYINMIDDPVRNQGHHFRSAESFLFGDGPIDRVLLRDPSTGEKLIGNTEKAVGCTLKRIVQSLSLDGNVLNIDYIKQGILRKLEKKRRADAIRRDLNR